MSIFRTATVAALFALTTASTLAQSAAPTVPSPADPFPENPVATDGSSLVGVLYGRKAVIHGSFVSEMTPPARLHTIR